VSAPGAILVCMAPSPAIVSAQAPGQSREITPVTRRDIFDFLRADAGPWWGRLGEIDFLDRLYDLDALPSTDPRHATAEEDIARHRIANLDWDDDWVFGDPRFQLADGPDQVLLDFLAQMADPLVRPDTDEAAGLVTALNTLLAPDGWELRTGGFISGRPIYSASRTVGGPGRMIRLQIGDGDLGKLDVVLGQAHHLLGENGDVLAQGLIMGAILSLRQDGGYFHPIPDDNWTEATYEAVLTVDPQLAPEFTAGITGRIWKALGVVLTHHGRQNVQSLVIEQVAPQMPAVTADWRDQVARAPRQAPGNQARRERTEEGYPAQDGLVFGSQAELAVYQALVSLQRDSQHQNSFAVLPLPGVRLRDAGVRTPDFVVVGNGRAVIIEVDGPRHYARTRKADDHDRDRHWDRCGVYTIRIASEHASDSASLQALLREDLRRRLWPS
jgi:AbiJ N-terminal domain 3